MSTAPATKAKWVSREARIEQLIAAAADSIARVGYADTTLATVAREAGMSPASVVFYFKTKDALLTETLRSFALAYKAEWEAALARVPNDPLARLVALVSSSFSPKVCNRNSIGVWHAFYGEAKSRPRYLEICGQLDDERHEQLRSACAELLEADGKPIEAADDLAIMIDAFGDGLWTDVLISTDTMNPREARRLAMLHLRTLLPDHAEAIAALEQAI
jgi:TetR/AcrR family transcriptional repressor of bet genes